MTPSSDFLQIHVRKMHDEKKIRALKSKSVMRDKKQIRLSDIKKRKRARQVILEAQEFLNKITLDDFMRYYSDFDHD